MGYSEWYFHKTWFSLETWFYTGNLAFDFGFADCSSVDAENQHKQKRKSNQIKRKNAKIFPSDIRSLGEATQNWEGSGWNFSWAKVQQCSLQCLDAQGCCRRSLSHEQWAAFWECCGKARARFWPWALVQCIQQAEPTCAVVEASCHRCTIRAECGRLACGYATLGPQDEAGQP